MSGLVIAAAVFVCVLAPAGARAAFGPLSVDFRISFMGPNSNASFGGFEPVVAYNPTADEYLVVWAGDDNTAPLVDSEFEIFAQRLTGAGAPAGGRIRVSEQGGSGTTGSSAFSPSVAYNAANDEYLVAWIGEIGTSNEFEVFAQRLTAAGAEVGGSDVRISDLGPDGSDEYRADTPSVTANSASGEYLVVWQGDDNIPPLVNDEFEMFGQRLTAAGAQTGANDFRISEQGADGDVTSQAFMPSVAYNPVSDQYLVAWETEIGSTEEFEIWAQRLTAAGAEVGGSDFQVSEIGPDPDPSYDALTPSVAANSASGEYFVVWSGDDNSGSLVNDEFEVYGQRLTTDGAQTGANDFRISQQGTDGDTSPRASSPSVAYDPASNEYLVVWEGFTGVEAEAFAQRLTGAGAEQGTDLRISDMGPDGNFSYYAVLPSVAVNPAAGEYLVVWEGDDDTPPLIDEEFEVFGRRLGVLAPALVSTDPAGPANENNPKLKGAVDAGSTIDVFTNATCSGAPAVDDAPGAALNGDGVAVLVADNTTTALSATASSDARTSRCSNSISYTEQTPADGNGTALVRRRARLLKVKVARTGRSLIVTIACPAGALRCANGTAGLKTATKVTRPAAQKKTRKVRALGRARFSIPSGSTKKVTLRLNRIAIKLLAKGRLRVRLTLSVPNRPARPLLTTKTLTIKRPARRRR